MIESINNNGGGGGGVQTVVAGTGISVDNTDPENPIVTNTVTDTDDKVRVSLNDTTAGYLNGKLVAGTGIGFTENNNGGNETLTVAIGNHDASLITSGTVATARLGTGTANSTTYLAGDQTYKTAVLSVAGKTGAVTLAAADIASGVIATGRLASTGTASSATFLRGDQTWASPDVDRILTTTCLDAENTIATRNIVTVSVPGGSGQPAAWTLLYVDFLYHTRNQSGGVINLASGLVINGTSVTTATNGVPNGMNYYGRVRQWFLWDGSFGTIRTVSPGQNALERNIAGPTYIDNTSSYWSFDSYPTVTTPSVTFNIQFTAAWASANASAFVRVLNARAYIEPGQTT
jgi:hypothetical protein